jgi:hypothetical protein
MECIVKKTWVLAILVATISTSHTMEHVRSWFRPAQQDFEKFEPVIGDSPIENAHIQAMGQWAQSVTGIKPEDQTPIYPLREFASSAVGMSLGDKIAITTQAMSHGTIKQVLLHESYHKKRRHSCRCKFYKLLPLVLSVMPTRVLSCVSTRTTRLRIGLLCSAYILPKLVVPFYEYGAEKNSCAKIDCASCAFEASVDCPSLAKWSIASLSYHLAGYWSREPFLKRARDLEQKGQYCSYHKEVLESS